MSLPKRNSLLLAGVAVALAAAGWMGFTRHLGKTAYACEPQPRAVFADLGERESGKPRLAITANGTLYMLAAYGPAEQTRLGLSMSHDGGDSFSTPAPASPEGARVLTHGENGPSLITKGMSVYALWQQSRDEGPAEIVFARQSKMGKPFDPPIKITDKVEAKPTFNGFSSMALAPDGTIYVVWLDGRDAAEPKGTFGVYLARSTDNGVTFSKNQRITLGACPCCRPSLAFGAKGEVFVAWRKVFPGDERDMVLARSTDSGQSFAAPVRIAEDHWVLHACPDSGPVLATLGGRLYAAWYSEGGNRAGVRLAYSDDGGLSFSPTQIASGPVLDANHPALSAEAGSLLLTFEGRSPTEKNGWSPLKTWLVAVGDDGRAMAPEELPGGAHPSSYPTVLSASSGRAYVAWSERRDNGTQAVLLRLRKQGE